MTDVSQEQGSPVLEGRVAGRAQTAFASYDLGELGYVEEEYFVSARRRATAMRGRVSARGPGRSSRPIGRSSGAGSSSVGPPTRRSTTAPSWSSG